MSWSNQELLLDAQTALNTTSPAIDVTGLKDWSVVVTISNDTFTSGTITIEASDDQDFSGTWAPLATMSETVTVPANDFSSVLAQNVQLVVSGSNLALNYVRARISAAIVGGATLTARLNGLR
jgi:hypothetical protein